MAKKTHKEAPKRGGRRKLTDEQVLKAVKEFNSGKRRSEIARELSVAYGTINAITVGRTWSWLTGIGPKADKALAA